MDAGIATAKNIAWLIEHGYFYLVVSRERFVQAPQRAAECRADSGNRPKQNHRLSRG